MMSRMWMGWITGFLRKGWGRDEINVPSISRAELDSYKVAIFFCCYDYSGYFY